MGGFGGGGVGRVHLLVEDLDRSPRSASFVAELSKNAALRVEAAQDTRRRIADGKAPAALVIPAGWGGALGTEQHLQLDPKFFTPLKDLPLHLAFRIHKELS